MPFHGMPKPAHARPQRIRRETRSLDSLDGILYVVSLSGTWN
jgi:hypothetical protein